MAKPACREVTHREQFDSIAEHLQLKVPSDWCQLSNKELFSTPVGSILSPYYQSSNSIALASIYPDTNWKPWQFEKVPRGFWKDPKHHRDYFDWLWDQLGGEDTNCWYNVNADTIAQTGGGGLISEYYGESLIGALKSVYPDIPWQEWRFQNHVPRNYWMEDAKQRQYFDWLAEHLQVQGMEDWYSKLNKAEIVQSGGGGLLRDYYSDVATHALQNVYPDTEWQVWQFDQVPKGYWQESEHQKEYLEWAAEKLCIRTWNEWYEVSVDHIANLKGSSLIQEKHERLVQLVIANFPQNAWNKQKFLSSAKLTKKNQKLLYRIVRELMPPNALILVEFAHPNLQYESTINMQLDVYVSRFKLAFELHGEQHYHYSTLYGDPRQQQQRDDLKRQACKEAGITLIEVPYWEQLTIASISDLIAQQMPKALEWSNDKNY